MENIRELVSLSQQLSAVIDDVGAYEVIEVSVDYKGRARIALSTELFFKHFKGFKIEFMENSRFKFHLTKVIQGVEFSTMTNDLSGLKVLRLIEENRLQKGRKKSLRALACE